MTKTKQATYPQTTTAGRKGFVLRDVNGGYFDINGIGEWSLAGDVTTCEIFGSVAEAERAICDNHIDEEDTEILAIVRAVSCVVFEREKD